MNEMVLRDADVPVWMRKARRGTDWGVLLALAFSLIAGWGFILQPGLPRTNASENYAFRTAETARAFLEWRLYPRWSAEALNGYGAPIPTFTPPGAAYVPALVQTLITADPVQAVRIVYVASLCLAGTALYTFVRRRSRAPAGIIACLLYVYNPYVSLTAPHLLGDLPGVMGMALVPALLWAVDRLLHGDNPPDFLYVALTFAALVATDPRAALAGGLLAVCLLVENVLQARAVHRAATAFLAITAGLLIAAAFWLPALIEQDAILWGEPFAARNLLISLQTLFRPLRPLDPGELIPTPQLTIGLASLIFTLISLPAIVRRRARFQALFLGAGVALIVLALTLTRDQVWLLGTIALCLAIAGSGVVHLPGWASGSRGRLFLPASVVAALALAFPAWIAPRWANAPFDTSPQGQMRYEQLGYGIAVLPADAPIPLPRASQPTSALAGGGKIAPGETDARSGIVAHGTHSDQFQVETRMPAAITIRTTYFPGWEAYFESNAVPLLPDSEIGGISVQLPSAGTGELTLIFGTSPTRLGGWAITWATLGITALVTRRFRRRDEHYVEPDLLPRAETRLITALTVAFAALVAVIALTPTMIAAPPGYTLDGSALMRSRSDAGLELLAYRLADDQIESGDTIDLVLFWRALRFLPENYQTRVSLLNLQTGVYYRTPELSTPGNYPTRRWLTNLYVRDTYTLESPVPAGEYAPAVEVFAPDGSRLTFFGSDGSAFGQVLVLPAAIRINA